MDLDGRDAEDLHRQFPGTSASILSPSTPPAAGGRLIGFYCLVCGYLRRAKNHQPSPTPMCASSKARTGTQHQPARMEPLFLD